MCVFQVDRELLDALDERFGPPVDSYVFGFQVWLEASSTGVELEYRLHPSAGFDLPSGVHPEELWDEVITQTGRAEFLLAGERRRIDELWSLLEVYPPFGDEAHPQEVREWAESALGRKAHASGYVDHGRLGKEWERRPGRFDLAGAILSSLEGQEPS